MNTIPGALSVVQVSKGNKVVVLIGEDHLNHRNSIVVDEILKLAARGFGVFLELDMNKSFCNESYVESCKRQTGSPHIVQLLHRLPKQSHVQFVNSRTGRLRNIANRIPLRKGLQDMLKATLWTAHQSVQSALYHAGTTLPLLYYDPAYKNSITSVVYQGAKNDSSPASHAIFEKFIQPLWTQCIHAWKTPLRRKGAVSPLMASILDRPGKSKPVEKEITLSSLTDNGTTLQNVLNNYIAANVVNKVMDTTQLIVSYASDVITVQKLDSYPNNAVLLIGNAHVKSIVHGLSALGYK